MSQRLRCNQCKKYRGVDDPELCPDCMDKAILKANAMTLVEKINPEPRSIALQMISSVFSRDSQYEVRALMDGGPEVKTCSKCHRTLTQDAFHGRSSRARSLCKECERISPKLYGTKGSDSVRGRIGLYQFIQLLADSGLDCPDCGVRMSNFVSEQGATGPEDVTVDHIIPYSLRHTDALENLRLCCRRCNALKGERLIWDLIEQHGLIELAREHLSDVDFEQLHTEGEYNPDFTRAA